MGEFCFLFLCSLKFCIDLCIIGAQVKICHRTENIRLCSSLGLGQFSEVKLDLFIFFLFSLRVKVAFLHKVSGNTDFTVYTCVLQKCVF